MLIAAILTFLSVASMVVNPAKIWLSTIFGLLFIPLTILDFILLIWAVKRRSKAFVIPLLAILPSFFFAGCYFKIIPAQESAPSGISVKMLSYNVGRFRLGKDCDTESCSDSIFSIIRREQPDIACIQEFSLLSSKNVKSYLAEKLPGYNVEYYLFEGNGQNFGNLTLSRFPIIGKGKIKFQDSANLALYTDCQAGNHCFRVYNCHFESYGISYAGIIRALFRADSDEVSKTGQKMKRSILRRPRQVDKVFSDIGNCPYDSFVVGDFNDNPMSYTYYRMMRGRKDTFREAGKGFAATYSILWPLLRLDYVLCPKWCNVHKCTTPRIGYSDHYPVIAELSIENQ